MKRDDDIWLGYCGSLSNSYDIKTVIDALILLKNDKVKFIVMGGGILKEEFESYAEERKANAVFLGALPYSEMCGVLSSCEIVINPIVGRSAASIINKHADYAAVGRPVINTQESPEYRRLVEDWHMGFNGENGNSEELAKNLGKLVENTSERIEMGKNSRKCALDKFDRATTYLEIVALFG